MYYLQFQVGKDYFHDNMEIHVEISIDSVHYTKKTSFTLLFYTREYSKVNDSCY